MKIKIILAIILITLGLLTGCIIGSDYKAKDNNCYLLHRSITVTIFWIGEKGSDENQGIPNNKSAWDDKWQEHYGGVDIPDDRNGYFPAGFLPKENPFYFALPYNDFGPGGKRKSSAIDEICWAKDKQWGPMESMCKNRWIKIIKGKKVAYAQWEDVGPFGEDDVRYVFGDAPPKNKINNHAGLDVSPAVRDYLQLSDIDKVDWQFVDSNNVTYGPWKQIITESQVYWE